MVLRNDLSDRLIHLTKAQTDAAGAEVDSAFNVFLAIINSRKLVGGTGFIKGGEKCVCFSEAPISAIGQFLADGNGATVRYQPFGVMFRKKDLYKRGARPVIYQEDKRFDDLPDHLKHLHVRFELKDNYTIDHTWEREWRLRADYMDFMPAEVTLILPNRNYTDAFVTHFTSLAKEAGEHLRYPWHHIVLEDLGIPFDRF